MKVLFELARCNRGNLKLLEVLLPDKIDSPLKNLYSLVFSSKILNDDQAMQVIYGKRKLATFSMLKLRLKDILIKGILTQNTRFETEHSRINESINQYRHTLVSKILVDQKNNKLAILVAERAIVKSIKYFTTENVISLSRILIRHYGVTEYNRNKLMLYVSIQEKYLRILSCEIKAENYYVDLQRMLYYSFSTPPELFEAKAKIYIEELDGMKDIQSYFFLINRHRVKAVYYEHLKDFDSLLKLCDTSIQELNKPTLRTNLAIGNINLRKVWALIQGGRNNEAIIIGTNQMKKLKPETMPWYYMAYYKLKAELYKGDYKNAVDLIKIVIETSGFSKVGENHRELFYATLGYIHLVVDSGITGDPKKLKKNLPDFKIGKFLNTTPVFSKDKRGINVSILLMHIAILLQRKKYDAIIDRTDSLKQYAYRYLRKDDTFRSNCMIKMVIQMTKADFNPIRTERYTKDLLEQLKQVKLAGSGENIETEIIPHEVLWTIMMKSLQR